MSLPSADTKGIIGWYFHEAAGTKKHGPTLDKPQTKFWRFDDAWWGVLARSEDQDAGGLSIFRFDEDTQQFNEAGDIVTNVPVSSVDAHIDGDDLFIASRAPEAGIELHRLHFDLKSKRFVHSEEDVWRLPGIETPSVSITTNPAGMIALTYATDRPYYLVAPKTSFPHLGEPICIPGAEPGLLEVDLSAAIALDDYVALLWSDQRQESFFCALLSADGSIEIEIPIAGGLVADDHIAARVFDHRLFVAVKTSRDDDQTRASDDSLLLLLVREPDGFWHHHTVARTYEPVTRPMPLLEPEAGLIHVFYTHGPNPGERSIRARSARLDELEFAQQETTVMAVPEGQLNDVTGPREPLTTRDGALIAASDGVHRLYHFAHLRAGSRLPMDHRSETSKSIRWADTHDCMVCWAASSPSTRR